MVGGKFRGANSIATFKPLRVVKLEGCLLEMEMKAHIDGLGIIFLKILLSQLSGYHAFSAFLESLNVRCGC